MKNGYGTLSRLLLAAGWVAGCSGPALGQILLPDGSVSTGTPPGAPVAASATTPTAAPTVISSGVPKATPQPAATAANPGARGTEAGATSAVLPSPGGPSPAGPAGTNNSAPTATPKPAAPRGTAVAAPAAAGVTASLAQQHVPLVLGDDGPAPAAAKPKRKLWGGTLGAGANLAQKPIADLALFRQDGERQIRAVYAAIEKDFARNNYGALLDSLAPDFTYITAKGESLNRTEFMVVCRMAQKETKKVTPYKSSVVRIIWHGRDAEVWINEEFTYSSRLKNDKTKMAVGLYCRDFWSFTPRGWKMRQSAGTDAGRYLYLK